MTPVLCAATARPAAAPTNLPSVEVLPPGHPETDPVRRSFSARMNRRYTGWCDAYDRQFDPHSFLFVLRSPCRSEYLATCRVVFKRLAGRELATPSEVADLDRYALPASSPRCCEGSMVGFAAVPHLRTLMYGVASWLMANGVDEVYTSHDVSNPLTGRFFSRTLGFVPVPGAVVRYRSFVLTSTGRPAAWQVVRGNPVAEGPHALGRLVRAGVTPYALPGDSPVLANWM